MKKICVIVIAIVFHTIAFGQISETLVSEHKLWSNLWQTASGSPPPHEMKTTFIKFAADTLIENESYKKVLESTDENQTDFAVIGYIREDSQKKVFFREKNETECRLLYDFGVEVGDTLNIRDVILVVELIDSVQVNDDYFKRIILSNEGLVGEQWIEGIGSLSGILASGYYGFTGGIYDLLCFYENEALVYSNPEFENCFYFSVGIGEFVTNGLRVQVAPNPVVGTSIMIIDGDFNNDDVLIEIFTLEGVRIKTIRSGKSGYVLQREDYLPGIYLFRVTQKNSKFTAGKFIVR